MSDPCLPLKVPGIDICSLKHRGRSVHGLGCCSSWNTNDHIESVLISDIKSFLIVVYLVLGEFPTPPTPELDEGRKPAGEHTDVSILDL